MDFFKLKEMLETKVNGLEAKNMELHTKVNNLVGKNIKLEGKVKQLGGKVWKLDETRPNLMRQKLLWEDRNLVRICGGSVTPSAEFIRKKSNPFIAISPNCPQNQV